MNMRGKTPISYATVSLRGHCIFLKKIIFEFFLLGCTIQYALIWVPSLYIILISFMYQLFLKKRPNFGNVVFAIILDIFLQMLSLKKTMQRSLEKCLWERSLYFQKKLCLTFLLVCTIQYALISVPSLYIIPISLMYQFFFKIA